MSIEETLGRIATTLEGILNKIELNDKPCEAKKKQAVKEEQAVKAKKKQAVKEEQAVTPKEVSIAVTEVSTTPVDEPSDVIKSDDSKLKKLNIDVMIEYERLGNDRKPIDELLGEFNVTGLGQLPEDEYVNFLDRLKSK